MPDTEHDITLEQSVTKGVYSVTVSGATAELTFSKAGSALWIIDHTGVPDALRGQGVGQILVERAVQDARAAGVRILPLCPFAKAQIAKHPEWQDIL